MPESMNPMTRMERTVELIQTLENHPHKREILSIAKEQLDDEYYTTYLENDDVTC